MTLATPRTGIPFVVSAPSGTGKTSVCRAALARDPELEFSISHTTRPPRAGERDAVDYHFVSTAEFRHLIEEGAFLEYAEYNGNLYGTSTVALDAVLLRGRDLLLEIEIQGAEQIHRRRPDARFVFLLPPSLAALEQRLRSRGTDAPEAVEKRLALAGRELAAADLFDYALVNDDFEQTVADLLTVIAAERAGRRAEVLARYGRERALEQLPWFAEARRRA